MENINMKNEKAKQVINDGYETPPVTEVIKEMTPEELEAFKRERYQKFIKPFLDQNDTQIKKKNKT
ncbi:hypothetical protein KHA93_21260 [Bacillus sp. FJAT-49732]|uniref:Uncharacterized protein n=1 Tax=Lederbergia citrisecunda TaxID=2833583 RepID=A0A942YMX9_9BACI|nr:hypothetical protein [Lederbergia citrisecunda]MBS4202142.1 hypothetical protein [Lederbergia citrisecunda]